MVVAMWALSTVAVIVSGSVFSEGCTPVSLAFGGLTAQLARLTTYRPAFGVVGISRGPCGLLSYALAQVQGVPVLGFLSGTLLFRVRV